LRALFENIVPLASDAPLLELAVTEVMNNIAIHSYGDQRKGDMRVHVEFSGKTLNITVWDKGKGPDYKNVKKTYKLPKQKENSSQTDLRPNGRGLFVVSKIVDSIGYDKIGDENKILLTKDIAQTSPPKEGEIDPHIHPTNGHSE